jgi:uncharacterized protein YjbJ (UPF0337 family)
MDEDRIKGKTKDVAGRVQRQVGEWTGDKENEAEGALKQAEGKVQNAFGKVKDSTRDAADDARRKSDVERGREQGREEEALKRDREDVA